MKRNRDIDDIKQKDENIDRDKDVKVVEPWKQKDKQTDCCCHAF